LDSARYMTPAGKAFALYLYDVTKRELKRPVDVLNILLGKLRVTFRAAEETATWSSDVGVDIVTVLMKWLKYLREEGYIAKSFTKISFVLSRDGVEVEGTRVEVTVEMPDGVAWAVEVAIAGAQIETRLLHYEVRRQLVVSQN